MKSPHQKGSSFRVAFVMDDRLAHDRKTVFTRNVALMKSRFSMEIYPSSISEDELLQELQKHHYGLVLLPWYLYISWKKIEAFYGALRLQGATVAGYFADAVLPFEFSSFPNYHRFILLDFYRFDQGEVEWILQSLVAPHRRSGFSGLFSRNTSVFFSEWYDDEATPIRSIEGLLKHPLLQNSAWNPRIPSLRLYMTALWSICFEKKRTISSSNAVATLEMAEFNRRLVIKLLFETTEHTLHSMMGELKPDGANEYSGFRELTRHADFLRIHQFPETQQVEITAFFTPSAPAIHYPNELRGWWIEPLNRKFAKTADDELFLKRVPISAGNAVPVGDQLQQGIELLRAALMQLSQLSPDERATYENRVSNIKFLVQEIDKKMLQKKAS